MKSQIAIQIIEEIENVIKEIESFKGVSEKVNSYLAKFLVVFICGMYEEAIEGIIKDMVNKIDNKNISNYIKNTISFSFRSPNFENIKKLLKNFDSSLEKDLQKLILEKNRIALENIVINKNSIAHGGKITITINDIINYYKDSKIVIEKIDKIILK